MQISGVLYYVHIHRIFSIKNFHFEFYLLLVRSYMYVEVHTTSISNTSSSGSRIRYGVYKNNNALPYV